MFFAISALASPARLLEALAEHLQLSDEFASAHVRAKSRWSPDAGDSGWAAVPARQGDQGGDRWEDINMINICMQFNTTAAEWTRTHAAQEKENQQKVKRLKVN